jgi:hypothetical protein
LNVNIRDLACFQHVKWKPNRGDLRKFALSMLIGFGVIGAIAAWRDGWSIAPLIRVWEIGAGLAAGAMIPGLGRFVYLAVYVVTGVIGYVVSRVMLTGIFYAIVTPLGLVLRFAGKDVLHLQKHPGETEWIAHAARRDRKSYYRQF